MVGERLEYEIELLDRTEAATNTIGTRLAELFDSMAVRAGAVGLALVNGLEDAAERGQQTLRRLRISTGTGTEDERDALTGLLAEGYGDTDAIAAIAALSGPGGNLGLDATNIGVGTTLAGLSAAGGNPTAALQALTNFNVPGGNVGPTLDVLFGTAASRGVGAGELGGALRNYGPVLSSLGLDPIQSGEFITDLASEGIDISRVSPALNRFIRDASAQGISPLAEGQRVFDEIAGAGDIEAAALGQDYFGAEGGLRLTNAIRSGRVGLGGELIPDVDLTQIPTLAALGGGTDREVGRRSLQAAELSGGLLGQLGTIGSAVTDLPFIGNVAASGAGRLAGLLGAGTDGTLANDQVVALLQQLVENTSAQGDGGYSRWEQSRSTAGGGLQE